MSAQNENWDDELEGTNTAGTAMQCENMNPTGSNQQQVRGYDDRTGQGYNDGADIGVSGRGGFPKTGQWAERGNKQRTDEHQRQQRGRGDRHAPYPGDRGHFDPQHEQRPRGWERGQGNQEYGNRYQGQNRNRNDRERQQEYQRHGSGRNDRTVFWSNRGNQPHQDAEGGYIDSGEMTKDGTPIRSLAGASDISDKRYYHQDPMVGLSKSLSWLLRHAAEKNGLKFMQGGFLYVNDILKIPRFKGFTLSQVREVVKSNDKQRFFLEEEMETRKWKIRANQGHSVEVEGLELKPVESADQYPHVVHGTYHTFWEQIKQQGLRRMSRNHMHFAPGEPGGDGVISGMRKTCEVLIFIDLEAALKDGLKFFVSSNNVLLSPGDKDGFIFPCYFKEAINRHPRYKLQFDPKIRSQTMSSEEVAAEAEGKGKKGKKKKNKNKKEERGTDGEDDKKKVSEEAETSLSNKTEDKTDVIQASVVSAEELSEEVESQKKKTKHKGKNKDKEADYIQKEKTETEQSISEAIADDANDGGKMAGSALESSEDTTDMSKFDDGSEMTEPSASLDDTGLSGKSQEITFKTIESVESCQEAVAFLEEQKSSNFVGVACFSPPSSQDQISLICVADQFGNVHAFDVFQNPEMIKDGGPLQKLFAHNSPLTKVFHACSLESRILFNFCKVTLVYTSIYDTKVAFNYWKKNQERNVADGKTLVGVCDILDIKLDDYVDAWDAVDHMDDLDWTVRPLNDYMKHLIKNHVCSLLKIKDKMALTVQEVKNLKKDFYVEAGKLVDSEEAKKVHAEQKKKADLAKKQDPNVQSSGMPGKKTKKKKVPTATLR